MSKMATGWYKVEALNHTGYSRGLAYFNSREEANRIAKEWKKFPSFARVTVREERNAAMAEQNKAKPFVLIRDQNGIDVPWILRS
jgi:hypothetical protein